MTVSGEALWTRSTKSVTVFRLCTVAVGLIGLLKKHEAGATRGGNHLLDIELERRSTRTSFTGCPSCQATCGQFSNEGDPVTSALPVT
jgi:hypothetical protein